MNMVEKSPLVNENVVANENAQGAQPAVVAQPTITGRQKIICLTGKMAAGKNAVADILERRGGLACVDFDSLVHKAIEEKTAQIIAAFSAEAEEKNIVLSKPDGTLNRRALGKLIFGNAELVARQESIVYPAVTQMAKEFVTSNADKNIVFNATVLYKIPELMQMCSAIIFVDSPLIIRLLRAKKRDNIPTRLILKRFAAQKKLFKFYKATGIPVYKIINSSSLNSLEKKVLQSLQILDCTVSGRRHD